MSFRLPQNLSTGLNIETGASVLDAEILAEKAASLGRAGRLVRQALDDLKAFDENPDNDTADPKTANRRQAALQAATDAVYGYFIQRELCGLMNQDDPIEQYAIPREVLARVGAK
ncbi:hypothetical protein HBA54_15785 [Pelagibius litoralis]|uniref:Uncharacterized protein n=1 Tax=Pelagibius litoralis TaxID=374515 RepID=A0A967KG50_9PROT|nr:DUF6665 family protein [Pelagibius litoralis]NIA70066.1 hypothetical protein [Pelagibius litoralis]